MNEEALIQMEKQNLLFFITCMSPTSEELQKAYRLVFALTQRQNDLLQQTLIQQGLCS